MLFTTALLKTENVHLLNVNKVVRKNSKVTKTNKLGCISTKKKVKKGLN